MLKHILVVFSLLFLFSNCGYVKDLNNNNYDQEVRGHEFSFMMLYAPWCGFCGTFKPIFEEAASKTDKFFFGRVDCTVEVALCQRLKVNYYPTLTFHRYGHPIQFGGERTAQGILDWLEKVSHYNGLRLNTQEEIDFFRKNNTFHAIGYFQNEESQAFRNFLTASEKRILHSTPVALVTNPALFDGRKEGTVDVFNSQTYAPIVLEENTELTHQTINELSSQIFQNTFPLLIHIDDNNYARYRQNRKNVYLTWLDLSSPQKEDNLKSLEELARLFPQFAFGYVDYEAKKERLYKLGAVRQQPNTILRIDFNSEESFIYELPQPFTVESISKWINGIVSGDVKPNILSELVPETNDGPVYKVVGTTFDEIVLDANKDVFVQFYIDWCEGCKYHQSFDKVGEALKGVEDVVVAKIDYNINDITNINLEIYGNPTFALYPKGDKKNPIVYSGSQTSDDLLRWFQKKTSSVAAKAVAALPKEPEVEIPDFDADHTLDENGEIVINNKKVHNDEL